MCRTTDNKCGCTSDSPCPSSQVCYSIDNKCYTGGLSLGVSCAADNGIELGTRCASGLCRTIDKKCGCTIDSPCPSSQVCYSIDNKCYTGGLSLGESCAADNGIELDTRCSSGICHNSQCTECLTDQDCPSSQVCYSVDNKCYSSGLSQEQSCTADNGVELNTRCASGLCRSSDEKCGCTSNSHCPSNQVCYSVDNKCYSSALSYGQSCSADNGDGVDTRCASGICFSTDNTCGCTSNSHCPSDQACYSSENGDNKCYPRPSSLSSPTSCNTISGVDSDGSAGDLIAADNGNLIIIDINGIVTDVSAQFAPDITTIIENINNFIIAAGQTANILGTNIVKAKRIVIDGTLNGNGGGYPGGSGSPSRGSSPVSNGYGGGGVSNSGRTPGGGGGGHGQYDNCDF